MHTDILKDNEGRAAVKRGIKAVADSVRPTTGPRGINVTIIYDENNVEITNDGKKIADSVIPENRFEKGGANLARTVSNKTNDEAGDGRSTSLILYDEFTDEGMKRLDVGMSGIALANGMKMAAKEGMEIIKDLAVEVKDVNDLRKVATVSAESEEIGKVIADLIDKVGKDGVITTQESNTTETFSEVAEGLEIDRGYISPYMITNVDRMIVEYDDAPILVTDKKVKTFAEIFPLIQKLKQAGETNLIIIAEDIEQDALAGIIANRVRGGFLILGIKAPGYGDKKKEILGDIATMVGTQVISEDMGTSIDAINVDQLGSARTIVATAEKTTIIGGKGSKESIDERVKQLQAQRANMTQKYQIELMDERIGRLTGGIGVIHVGAITEKDMNYLRAKVSDAVASAKAASAEGIVPGGGTIFIRVADQLRENLKTKELMDEERIGYEIVIKVLTAPFKQILVNSGVGDEYPLILEKVRNGSNTCGYNAKTLKFVDNMFDDGVVDAAKVVRLALLHSASEAALFLTSGQTNAIVPDKKNNLVDQTR